MIRGPNQAKRSFSAIPTVIQCAGLGLELIWLPIKWRKRLRHVSVISLMDEIEESLKSSSSLSLSPQLIMILVKKRVSNSHRWKSNRCLLGSLLCSYCFSRLGFEITMHIGCRLKQGKIDGHSWISSSHPIGSDRFQASGDMTEMYRKTFSRLLP
jgi:hypothetical protein